MFVSSLLMQPLVNDLCFKKESICSPIDEVMASAMNAGVAPTLVHLRQAGGIIVALWAQAGVAVDAVNAGSTIVTGVDGTLIDVDVAHCSWKKQQCRMTSE